MLVDVEQVMRVAFRPVGQTELQRWLADLGAKDGIPPLTREAPPEPPAARSTVGPLQAGSGQESGLVLNLDDAEEIRSADKPPPTPRPPVPAATEVMRKPPAFAGPDRPWHRQPAVRVGVGLVLLVIAVAAGARVMRRRTPSATGEATPAPTGSATVPAPASPPAVAPPAEKPAEKANAPASDSAAAAPATASAGADATAPAAAQPESPTDASEHPAEAEAKPTGEEAPPEEAAGGHSHRKGKPPQFPVVIKSDPEGSRVATGRHVFGKTPLTLRLRPGNSYELTFTRAGYAPVSRHFRFDDYAPQTLRITLTKKGAEAHKAAAPPAAAPTPAASPAKNFFSR
jgi:hypothetical protein